MKPASRAQRVYDDMKYAGICQAIQRGGHYFGCRRFTRFDNVILSRHGYAANFLAAKAILIRRRYRPHDTSASRLDGHQYRRHDISLPSSAGRL